MQSSRALLPLVAGGFLTQSVTVHTKSLGRLCCFGGMLLLLVSLQSQTAMPSTPTKLLFIQTVQQWPTSYVPKELHSVLVCITAQFKVAKLSYLETILLEAVKYQSPSVDVLLVTDNTNALQRAVSRLQLPLNITYHQGKQPPGDSNVYWLTWEHRAAIEQAVARKNYSTVVYMEDDTRVTWPTLVSWAIDTRLLAPQNFSRCFYRSEVRPADGGLTMIDHRSSIDVRPGSPLKQIDMLLQDAALFNKVAAEIHGSQCGTLRNGTAVPCVAHRHFTATHFPFQGMWLATTQQLQRFMQLPMWDKEGALAFNATPFLSCTSADKNEVWGYPERSASIAVLGGLTHVTPDRPDACGSCMLPYHPRLGGQPARLAHVARIDHLRNAYTAWGSIPMEQAVIS